MPARNDPCPCGSGKKYKHCHLTADDAARRNPHGLRNSLHIERGATRAAASRRDLPHPTAIADDWEVALAPLNISIGDTPDARPVAIVVAAGQLALHVELESTLGAEAPAIAAAVVRAYHAACDAAGRSPRSLALRDDAVARLVRQAIEPLGVAVRAAASLPAAEAAAHSLRGFMAPKSNPAVPAFSHPETWAGWRLDRALVGRLHAAAASYYRAAPWKVLADDEPIYTGPNDPPDWTAVVLGHAGMTFGLALYANVQDVLILYAAGDTHATAPPPPTGAVLSVTFAPADEVPMRMRRETLAARWEIAGPHAWPLFFVLGTPGGGVTAAQVEALVERLESVPRFVKAHRSELAGEIDTMWPLRWSDPANGLAMALHGAMEQIEQMEQIEPSVFDRPEVLVPSGPEGPAARPGATLYAESVGALDLEVRRILALYAPHLATGRATGPTMERRYRVAAHFLMYVIMHQRVPLEAVTEYELRKFVYAICPLEDGDLASTPAGTLTALKHFFAFARKALGLHCPWATAVLADRTTMLVRWYDRPASLAHEAERDEWLADLDDDLADRVLLLPNGDDVGVAWPASRAEDSGFVASQAHRHWLVWRDELIRAGTTDPHTVAVTLVARMKEWLDAPNAAFGGKAPRSALGRRRAKRRR